MSSVDRLPLHLGSKAQGTVRVPGSKSLSNRLLLLAAVASGETTLTHLLDSDDIQRMRDALAALGVETESREAGLWVRGAGGRLRAPSADPLHLHLGNAGTAMRPLTALLAHGEGTFILDGDPRMRERPLGPLVDALRSLGADITYLGMEGYPPLKIEGRSLAGGAVRIDGTLSSQFVTALMMLAPQLPGGLKVHREGELVSDPYLEITRRCLAHFGADSTWPEPRELTVPEAPLKAPGLLPVEGDASSASYFLALGALAGGPVRVTGVGRDSMQGDVAFLDVLAQAGAVTRSGPDWLETEGGTLQGIDVDLNAIPDAAMTLGVVALFAQGPTRIRGVANWRVKETDRIAAMATELRKLGAAVEEHSDGITVTPPEALRPAQIATYDDHRIAMCFSLAALGGTEVVIEDPTCVRKTYPSYFTDFIKLFDPSSWGVKV